MEVNLPKQDFNSVRELLRYCLDYFEARTLAERLAWNNSEMQNPVALELEAVIDRLDNIYKDYLLEQDREEKEEGESSKSHEEPEAEE